jgi:hypothetical protein
MRLISAAVVTQLSHCNRVMPTFVHMHRRCGDAHKCSLLHRKSLQYLWFPQLSLSLRSNCGPREYRLELGGRREGERAGETERVTYVYVVGIDIVRVGVC